MTEPSTLVSDLRKTAEELINASAEKQTRKFIKAAQIITAAKGIVALRQIIKGEVK